jgi:post-segregation antitoxin (ccd killing protein)
VPRRAKKYRAGRPPLFGERMRRVNIMLTDDDLERARKIGNGNVSKGIRLALQRAVRRTIE